MQVEYEAIVPESIKDLADEIIRKVFVSFPISKERTEVLRELMKLRDWLNEPIHGTIEVESEEIERAEREPYPDWYDMD